MKPNPRCLLLALCFFCHLALSFSQESNPGNPSSSAVEPPYSQLFKTTYLDLSAIYNDLENSAILDLTPPPFKGTVASQEDQDFRERVFDNATKKEIHAAQESEDSIFAYSYTLGHGFSPQHLPKTKALFDKVDDDVRLAIFIAKRFYGRRRPMHSSGYSYPSGHSTRAFLWETLLSEIFPDEKKELETQAKQKAWNRVILGRHYPDDVYAGRIFGTYLAQEILKNPDFQEAWQAAQKEITACVGTNKNPFGSASAIVSVP